MKIVSFCIPSYNNAEGTYQLAFNLLKCNNTEMEVVICDDNSTDDSFQRLKKINDSRLHIYKNERNLGAQKNWNRALELGQGYYLYLVMNGDILEYLQTENVISWLYKLKEQNIKCARDWSSDGKMHIYQGVHSFVNFLGTNHPTGLILERTFFHNLSQRETYFSGMSMYPECYVARDFLIVGRGAYIPGGLFVGKHMYQFEEVRSTVEYSKKKPYYFPEKRREQFYEILKMVLCDDRINLTEDDRLYYLKCKYRMLLYQVSIAWKSDNENRNWSEHYGKCSRRVNKREMIKNIITTDKEVRKHYAEGFKKKYLIVLSYEKIYAIGKALLYSKMASYIKRKFVGIKYNFS